MKYIKVRIVIGSSTGVFDIYYDSIDSNKRALLYSNGQPATGVTFNELSGPNGVLVSVPDESSSIVVTSDPDSFCSNDINVNNDSYTTPIGCYTYTITSSNGVYNYYYTDCDCNEISATIDGTNGQVEESFCALYGTVDAGELELTFVEGCETTSVELCYDENSPTLACVCELVTTPTPTPTETPTPTPIELIELFRSGGVPTNSGHCGQNYLINTSFYGIASSIPSLLDTTVYSDTNFTPFDGQNLWYAAKTIDNTNTNAGEYYVIEINSFGTVTNVAYVSTDCDDPISV